MISDIVCWGIDRIAQGFVEGTICSTAGFCRITSDMQKQPTLALCNFVHILFAHILSPRICDLVCAFSLNIVLKCLTKETM